MKTKTKSKKMNMSKKERNLLVIVLLLVIIVIYYMFVFQSLQGKVSSTEQEISDTQTAKQQADASIAQVETTKTEIEGLKAKIYPIAQKYFGSTDQEEFIMNINRLNQLSGLNITNISFSEYQSINLDQPAEGAPAAAPAPPTEGTEDEPAEGTPAEGTEGAPAEGASAPAESNTTTAGRSTADVTQAASDAELLKKGQEIKAGEDTSSDNVKLMQAQLQFTGTYSQVLKLLHEIDQNPKNIISSQLQMQREGDPSLGEEKDTQMSGNILLSFFQVKNVDNYVAKLPSVLETAPIPKSGRDNPFLSYSWAWTYENGAGGATPSYQGSPSTPSPSPSPSAIKPPTGQAPSKPSKPTGKSSLPKPGKSEITLQNKEVYGFEGDDFDIKTPEGVEAEAVAVTDTIQTGTKAAKLTYTFSGNEDNERIYLDLTSKKLVLKQKVEGLGLSIYAEQTLPHETGIRIRKSDGTPVLIVLAKEISWNGWKNILYDLKNLQKTDFPITIEGVYVENSKGSDVLGGTLIFDNMFINYLE